MVLRYSQYVLISIATSSINQSAEQTKDTGYAVIALAVIMYTGLAVGWLYELLYHID